MSWTTSRFSVGQGIGLVGPEVLVLVLSDSLEGLDGLWSAVERDAPLDEILERLSGRGLRSLPSFAIVRVEGDRMIRVVVRGTAVAELSTETGPLTIESRSARTWVEREVTGVVAVTIATGERDGSWVNEPRDLPFRVAAGVVPASCIHRWLVAPPTANQDSADPPLALSTEAATEDGEREDNPAGHLSHQADSGATLMHTEVDQLRWPAPDNQAEAGSPERAIQVDVDDDKANPYDDLFGRTVARSVQRAAVQETPVSEPPRSDLIDTVPADQSVVDTGSVLGDHDGRTISRGALNAMKSSTPAATASGPLAPIVGPTVLARMCTVGHPNATHLTVCRSCGGPVMPEPPILVSRPELGVLRFSNGVVIHLDRPQIIGRNPRIEGNVSNEIPNLVRLEVAGQGLSRRHVAVHLENWQVLLEDLNSANGTIVTLPGRAPRRLLGGETIVLEAGAVIDLGGEVSAAFEATR